MHNLAILTILHLKLEMASKTIIRWSRLAFPVSVKRKSVCLPKVWTADAGRSTACTSSKRQPKCTDQSSTKYKIGVLLSAPLVDEMEKLMLEHPDNWCTDYDNVYTSARYVLSDSREPTNVDYCNTFVFHCALLFAFAEAWRSFWSCICTMFRNTEK